VLVGVAAGQVAGAAIVTEGAGRCGEAYYIAVDPGSRGRGLGRALVTAAEIWLVQRGVRTVQLRVETENTNAAAFYRRLGFQMTGRLYMEKLLPGEPPQGPGT
jgi:ribosomal protein S18 acetylase RimI-like enzyme